MKIALTLTKREITSAINNKYIEYLHNAGHQPIMFDQRTKTETINEICDGLLLKGGSDIDPLFYGIENVSSFEVDPELDDFERNLFWEFVLSNKPVFGICRGFQLIFRELSSNFQGGNIPGLIFKQNIEGHDQNRKNIKRIYSSHFVTYIDALYDFDSNNIETKYKTVNSMHHQAVTKHTGKNSKKFKVENSPIIPVAWKDSVLEAFIAKDFRVLAVQWHPEEMNDIALLENIFGENNAKQIGA